MNTPYCLFLTLRYVGKSKQAHRPIDVPSRSRPLSVKLMSEKLCLSEPQAPYFGPYRPKLIWQTTHEVVHLHEFWPPQPSPNSSYSSTLFLRDLDRQQTNQSDRFLQLPWVNPKNTVGLQPGQVLVTVVETKISQQNDSLSGSDTKGRQADNGLLQLAFRTYRAANGLCRYTQL